MEEVRIFVVSSCRNGIYMAFPIIVFLLVNGTPLVQLWMGSDYADSVLIQLLVLGYSAELCNQPLESLLLGLNCHGRPGLVMMLATVVAILATWILLSLGFGLRSVALAIGIPWFFANGIYLPYYTCRRLGISLFSFLWLTWKGPIATGIPFGFILMGGVYIFPHQMAYAIITGTTVGCIFLFCCYWLWVLPTYLKQQVMRRLRALSIRKLPCPAALSRIEE